MSFRYGLIAAAGCIALAGCNTMNSHIGDEDPAIGEAVKYNAAVQTINPEPVYAENSAKPGSNGDKMAQAVKRYRTDQVNDRHRREATARSSGLSTTSGVGGSGSSGPQ
jgi:hypothetical protein